jgi:3-hydroxyisobutyrate dehydrogenase-like beta-hydroxyacid dehydrogenase
MKLGFVGLGKMGAGMARNLLRAGHSLTVYNRTREKAEALTPEGAKVASSPAEAARGADAVFSIVSDDAAVYEATFGRDGISSGLQPRAIHISSTTISVACSKKLDSEHKAAGQSYVAATVFGRPVAAENKKLIVVTAGDTAAMEKLLPVFDAIGRRTFQVGQEPWRANAIKLCGNFMIASMLETFAEAFTTVAKAGIERQTFLDVMNELWGSPVYANYGKGIVDRKFEASDGFGLALGLKDVRLALELAQDLSSPMPIASLVRDHLLSAIANGQGSMDWSSLELVLARGAGLDQKGP